MKKGIQITIIEGNVMSCVRLINGEKPIAAKLTPAPAVINLIRPSSMENYSQYFLDDALRPCNRKIGPASLQRSSS